MSPSELALITTALLADQLQQQQQMWQFHIAQQYQTSTARSKFLMAQQYQASTARSSMAQQHAPSLCPMSVLPPPMSMPPQMELLCAGTVSGQQLDTAQGALRFQHVTYDKNKIFC
ncbi:hypothetical protein PR202_ga02914 [Eleusine coracana subsp. coracana]|uniref:Uncharacterized protein n=1 Tax=Eleusine coracana subsp. coracana TaxID=191504 RepID=A0AAV5BMQ6_ELECO|nr:hypothetical protein PR202_ga02914 [Eleusine coracana subsp. coracana]